MGPVLKGLAVEGYRRHCLHDLARDWPETNCYVDLWIEVLSALGLDPVVGLGFTVRQDFEGDQFTFFKYMPADLETLYGAEILELAIFDDLIGHLEAQVGRGRLPVIELDGYFLPDTKGVSYKVEHTKTTIGVNVIDRAAKRIEYFHNAGYFALSGDDFDGLFRQIEAQKGVADQLFPYTEFVKLDRIERGPVQLAAVLDSFSRHFARRPLSNPIRAYKANFSVDADRLVSGPPAFFHKYTFNVLRQLGANNELLASHLGWMKDRGVAGLDRAIGATREISASAKSMQFQLARAVARRNFTSFNEPLDRMADAYDMAFEDLRGLFGGVERRLAS